MSDNKAIVEQHGCIVCGKTYNMLVVYNPAGKFIDATVTSPGGHRVPDDRRPLVVCDWHPAKDVQKALANHYPGAATDDDQ